MRGWWAAWAVVLSVAGCHAPRQPCESRRASQPSSPQRPPSTVPKVELAPVEPVIPRLDARGVPETSPRVVSLGPVGTKFLGLRESDCLKLAVAAAMGASVLEEEDQVPPRDPQCPARSRLQSSLRYHTSLELRNRAAADALERYFQLVEVEARSEVLRKAFPVIDALAARAREAKAANVRFPFEPADLERERSLLESQLEQADLGSRLLNVDLARRLGLSPLQAGERLWPVGDFSVDPSPFDAEAAVTAAMADRPELRGLRNLRQGLTVDALPEARDVLHAGSPLLGASQAAPSRLLLLLAEWCARKKGNDPREAELEVRRRQLDEVIRERERDVGDEARAAVLTGNAQLARMALARNRLAAWEQKLSDAEKKREAKQPGAEFLVPQMQLEVFKARAELIGEVAAWHHARIRVRAAQGWLVWEAITIGKSP